MNLFQNHELVQLRWPCRSDMLGWLARLEPVVSDVLFVQEKEDKRLGKRTLTHESLEREGYRSHDLRTSSGIILG